MLVISLKVGEKLKLGRDITVTVLESRSGKVRLGIEAPLNVNIAKDKIAAPADINGANADDRSAAETKKDR